MYIRRFNRRVLHFQPARGVGVPLEFDVHPGVCAHGPAKAKPEEAIPPHLDLDLIRT